MLPAGSSLPPLVAFRPTWCFSSACYSAEGRCRCRFVAARCSFAARRRWFEPRVGLVALRRAASGAIPSATRLASLAKAISRLRSWERFSEAVTVMTPATRRRSRRVSSMSLWPSERTVESSTFQRSSTRLSEVLTCCPPGPDDRENRQPSSAAGIVSAGDTSKSMQQALHTRASPKPESATGCFPFAKVVPGFHDATGRRLGGNARMGRFKAMSAICASPPGLSHGPRW